MVVPHLEIKLILNESEIHDDLEKEASENATATEGQSGNSLPVKLLLVLVAFRLAKDHSVSIFTLWICIKCLLVKDLS